jgi:NAD(P)-dependent dehydrogenase (short-subunit alcohol dehydrogenase family)
MDLQLSGKRALVTGGARGIGRAIARQLALEGARVVVTSRSAQSASDAAAELTLESGAVAVGLPVDTGDEVSVRALVQNAVHHLGGLDILVNSAARPGARPKVAGIAGVEDEAFWEDINVKVLGYIRMVRAAAPHLTANGWGRIINISGLAARQTGSIIGSIRNVAVSALTKNLADELGPQGVNVTVVHPGLTRTEQTAARLSQIAERDGVTAAEAERRLGASSAIRRIVDASEVADIVAFLASPRSAAITGDGIACGGGTPGPIYY